MSRRLNRLLAVCLLLLLAVPAFADPLRITILHTNDRHGIMESSPYHGEDAPVASEDLGGMARMATAISQIRAATPDPVIVVDTGDVFTRGPWHGKWYGEPEFEAMNLMGYDLFCVGNNELKAIWEDPVSKQMMLTLMRRSRFPWLAANLTLGDGPPPGCDDLAFVEGIHPFVVRTFDGVRVGFLGLTTSGSAEYPHLTGWTVGDELEAARRWVPIARKECDVLIAITHLGAEEDRELAQTVTGIDAIVGGHSHTFLSQPLEVTAPDGRQVPIAQAGESGVVLGRLDLTFEQTPDGWRLTAAAGRLLPMDGSYPDCPAVKAFLDRYLATPAPAAASP